MFNGDFRGILKTHIPIQLYRHIGVSQNNVYTCDGSISFLITAVVWPTGLSLLDGKKTILNIKKYVANVNGLLISSRDKVGGVW